MSRDDYPIRIAVIEDDREFRNRLAFLLNATEDLRCVASFENATEALASAVLASESPDVVLLDLDLGPEEPDGNASLPKLRETLPMTKFLVLTALDQPERVFEALRRGASGYLCKTYSLGELPAAVRDVNSGNPRFSPDVFRLVYEALQNPPPLADEWRKLSKREREILELLALGYAPKDVTTRLAIAYDTFKSHCTKIQEKLQVRGNQQAVQKVFPKKTLTLFPRWLYGGRAIE